MRHNPLTNLIAQQEDERRQKKGKPKSAGRQIMKASNEEKHARARLLPAYEHMANWRGIERVFEDPHNDPYPINVPGTPGFYEKPENRPGLSLSPLDLIRDATPNQVTNNLQQAIHSARLAMRPHLETLASESRANSVAGERQHTQRTEELYQRMADMLLNQYRSQTGIPDVSLVHWPNFADWLLSRQYEVSASTWQMYRAAIFSILDREHGEEASIAHAILRTDDDLADGMGRENTSGMNRIKKITPDDYDRIIHHCVNKSSPNTQNLLNYLRASIRVGLRPKEYLTSEIRFIPDNNAPLGRQVWLFVCNAKYSNGRANGPIRALDLSMLNSSAIESINMCIADARTHSAMNGYESWLKSLNRTMKYLAASPSSGVKESYTAYSARHQAVANWKSMYDLVAVAALAGHAFPDTAHKHYGAEKDAWPKERLENVLIRPSAADVQRIERRIDMAKARMEQGKGPSLMKFVPEMI